MIFYLLLLTKLIMFKRPPGEIKNLLLHQSGWRTIKKSMHVANIIPFHTIRLYLTTKDEETNPLTNLLGNIAGFIPMGLLLPVLFKRIRTAFKTIAIVFLISLCFETFQLLTGLGYFDVDDLLLNTVGGIIGYFCFAVCVRPGLIK